MSVKLPAPLKVNTVMGAIDAEGRRTAQRARTHSVEAVRRLIPSHSGRARSAARGSVTRSPTGWTITVSPSKRIRYPNGVSAVEVTRFFEGGTGPQGPRGELIPPEKRGHLPNGAVPRGLGQRAQHPYARVQSAEEARVERLLADGAPRAAEAAERALGGR